MSNTQPYTVMTVCTGNICRSPMGEIILRHFFNERGLGDQVNVESSGVSDEEWSHPIDPRAVRVLRERGYGDEIPRDHFAHRISREEIDRTDLFLPMTASHMRALLRMLPAGKRAEVHMYRSFDPNLPKPKPGREDQIDLVDPWYGGKHEFEVAIDQIEGSRPVHRRLGGEAAVGIGLWPMLCVSQSYDCGSLPPSPLRGASLPRQRKVQKITSL